MYAEQTIPARSFGEADPDFLVMAERELAAFARAVKELFGPEQERQSIEDWMQELESIDWSTREVITDWRDISIAAALRLADRVCLLR